MFQISPLVPLCEVIAARGGDVYEPSYFQMFQLSPDPSSQKWNHLREKWPMNLPENARLPRNIQGSFTCRKSTTWYRRLYFPSEGRRTEDFFALKNPTASVGFEPAKLGTKGQHATSRPPKPPSLMIISTYCNILLSNFITMYISLLFHSENKLYKLLYNKIMQRLFVFMKWIQWEMWNILLFVVAHVFFMRLK